MTTLELTLNLPDELAQRAKNAGLLTPDAIEPMLREQLKKQAGEQLRAPCVTSVMPGSSASDSQPLVPRLVGIS